MVFSDVGDITAGIIIQTISQFFLIISIGLPDWLDRLGQFSQTSTLNFSHETASVCVGV